jgi:hypothetical protein
MVLSDIHAIFANAFTIFALTIAGWSLVQYFRRQEMSGGFWGAVIIGEGLVLVQSILGVIMWVQGVLPARLIHFLYGAIALLSWPAVFAFTRGGTSRRDVLYWALVSIFLFGIALRARATALP